MKGCRVIKCSWVFALVVLFSFGSSNWPSSHTSSPADFDAKNTLWNIRKLQGTALNSPPRCQKCFLRSTSDRVLCGHGTCRCCWPLISVKPPASMQHLPACQSCLFSTTGTIKKLTRQPLFEVLPTTSSGLKHNLADTLQRPAAAL